MRNAKQMMIAVALLMLTAPMFLGINLPVAQEEKSVFNDPC